MAKPSSKEDEEILFIDGDRPGEKLKVGFDDDAFDALDPVYGRENPLNAKEPKKKLGVQEREEDEDEEEDEDDVPDDEDEEEEKPKTSKKEKEVDLRHSTPKVRREDAPPAPKKPQGESVDALESKKANANLTIANIDAKREAAMDKIAKAQEEGETRAAVVATDELQRLNIDRDKATNIAAHYDSEIRKAKTEKKEPEVTAPNRDVPELRSWLSRNEWFNKTNKTDAEQRRADMAMVVDRRLGQEGYDIQSPQYYKLLDQELRKAMGDSPKTKQRKGSAISGQSRDGNEAPGSKEKLNKNSVTITKKDTRMMQNFRLDPNDPKTIARYAAEKRKAGLE